MSGRICLAAFSKRGAALALRVAEGVGGEVWTPPQHGLPGTLPLREPVGEWAGKIFPLCDALIFVSACGIAVRAVAPWLRGKDKDPAVVVLDERGRHVVSLLSGHLGGANALAKRVAAICGGTAVVTTATDVGGVPAIDEWAADNDCAIENLAAVKSVSAAALEGERIGVAVTEQTLCPPWPVTLWLRPKNLVLGAGCKKGVSFASLKEAFDIFMAECGCSPLSLAAVASIDVKKEEAGLIELANHLAIPFVTFTAQELKSAVGAFSASQRVEAAVGVDNVCERAAVLKSDGFLLRGKTKYNGITFALAKIRGNS